MILQEKLKVKIGSKQYKYYTDLGYNVCVGELCEINNCDIIEGSTVLETRKCDICGKEYTKKHIGHIKTYQRFNKDICPCCVRNNEEIKKITKERRKDSVIKHYGVDNPSKNEEIKHKKINSVNEHYGVDNPMQSNIVKKKAQDTNIEKYGYTSPAKNQNVKAKTKQTCLNKYGVEYTGQIPESRIKANESYYQNGTQKVSSHQLTIFNMLKEKGYEVELNYPLSSLSLDIYILYKEVKIDIEYDGSYWHQDGKKDRRRDEFVKSQGYKILRIKSDKQVPTLELLLEELDKLIESQNNFHKIEI